MSKVFIFIFVLFCFVLVIACNRYIETFSSHNSDFIPDLGIFNNEKLHDIQTIINRIPLEIKPERKATFSDTIGFIPKETVTETEQQQLILWIQNNIRVPLIRLDTLYKEHGIIYSNFYIDNKDPVYYILVSIEFKLTKNNDFIIYKLKIKGLISKLNVKLLASLPTKKGYNSFIDEPDEQLSPNMITNILQQFEENKKELLLRNKQIN